MPDNSGNSEWSLEKLKKRLYRRGEGFEERGKEPGLREYVPHAQKSWPVEISDEEIEEVISQTEKHSRRKVFIIVISAFLFLALLGAAAFWYLFGGFGGISPKDIVLTIEGPEEIQGGDLAEWKIFIENNSDRPLEFADFVFKYPDGSRPFSDGGVTPGVLRLRKDLGRVAPNSRLEERFRAFVFGEENASIEAAAALEYRFEDSNVILARDEKFVTKITRSPVVVSISAPQSLNSGDQFELKVEYISEAKDTLDGVVLEMEYPDNFVFIKASPRPSEGNSAWAVGDLKPGERRTVRITGILNSQEHAEETFRAYLGVFEGANRMVFGSDATTIFLARQFLDLSFRVSGKDGQVFKPGEGAGIDIIWKNNLPVAVENAVLKIAVTGNGFDPRTLRSEGGSFVALENAMRWGPVSNPAFAFVEPGEEGVLRLSFNVPKFFDIRSAADSNFGVKLAGSFSVPTNPLGFEGVDISGERTIDLKIETNMQIVREGYYYFSTLPGSGPLPPKVGRETIYTIVWSMVNSSNDIKKAVVSAILPQYMTWVGAVSPSDAKITYNKLNGKIEWSLELLRAGTGILRQAEEVAFQVGFTPAVPDIDHSPVILSEVTAIGVDDFTGTEISDKEPALTTDLRGDPKFKPGDSQVVP